jgi:hypothetical protein
VRRRCGPMLLLCIWALPVAAADLGRLFLSPGERAALDRARQAAALPAPAAPVEMPGERLVEDVEEGGSPLPEVAIDGVVAKRGGGATVWVNGMEAGSGDLDPLGIDAARIEVDGGRVRVPLAQGDGIVLKPGQRFDPASARVSDAYERPPAPSTEGRDSILR